MEEAIKDYLFIHGYKKGYEWQEPTLLVNIRNGAVIKIDFDMILIKHSMLDMDDCVRKVLDKRLKGVER